MALQKDVELIYFCYLLLCVPQLILSLANDNKHGVKKTFPLNLSIQSSLQQCINFLVDWCISKCLDCTITTYDEKCLLRIFLLPSISCKVMLLG